MEDRCEQWTGSRCGVIDMAIETQDAGIAPTLDRPLPRCSIRPRCRWFAQAGPRACAVCPLVITDGRVDPGARVTDGAAAGERVAAGEVV